MGVSRWAPYWLPSFYRTVFGILPSCFLTVAIITCTGVISGFAVAKFRLPSFIITFAMLAVEVSAALVISGGNRIGVNASSPFVNLATGLFVGIPYQIWLALGILALGEFFLRRTPYGRHLYAVGSNMNAARVPGVSPDRIIMTAFAISAAISGVAELVYASYTTAGDPLAAGNLNLEAIAAAVIGGVSLFGGRGSLVRGFIGAVIYALITRMLYLYGASSNLAEVVGGIISILAAFSSVLGARRSRA